jgi:hypothetical protein
MVAGFGAGYLANRLQGTPVRFRVQRLDPIQIEGETVAGDPFATGKRRAFVCRASSNPLPQQFSYVDQFFGGFSTDPPLGAAEEFYAVSDHSGVIGVVSLVAGDKETVSIAEFTLVSGHYVLSDQRYFKNTNLSTFLKELK